MVERMGALSPQRAAELCMQALAALAHAHSMGVVHRDLKPANMMITESGAVKIMDFGIARVAGTEHLTNAGFMMGTPAYMAPEQVLGDEIDARADLYAMGVVFYRLTTAQAAVQGRHAVCDGAVAGQRSADADRHAATDLPPWVEPVVAARARQRTGRALPVGGRVLRGAFARCLAGLPMTTPYNPSAPTELMTTPRARSDADRRAVADGRIRHRRLSLPPPLRTPSPGTAQIGTGPRRRL